MAWIRVHKTLKDVFCMWRLTKLTEEKTENNSENKAETEIESTGSNTDTGAQEKSGQQNSSKTKQPFVLGLIIVGVAVAILIGTQVPDSSSTSSGTGTAGPGEGAEAGDSLALKSPKLGNASDTPNIVQNMNRKEGSVGAPGLDMLVKGLEDKVASDPGNVGNRILLAQTYNELGMQDKALTEMRNLQKEQPDNGRVNLVLGSILSSSNDQDMVKESLGILDKASGGEGIQQYLVDMYKGDALIRMQDHDGALKHWKAALENMPASDNRRVTLEQRISNLSAKDKPKEEESKANTQS